MRWSVKAGINIPAHVDQPKGLLGQFQSEKLTQV